MPQTKKLNRLLQPSWSPDGSKLASIALENNNTHKLCVIHADGSLVIEKAIPGDMVWYPKWFQNGEKILFKNTSYIGIVNPDGSDLTGILWLHSASIALNLHISPDGKMLIYTADNRIFLIRIEKVVAALQTECIPRHTADMKLYWVPDDKLPDLQIELLIEREKITNQPSWNSNGTKILFQSQQGIEIFDLEKKTCHVLVQNSSTIYVSVWSPVENKIAYLSSVKHSLKGGYFQINIFDLNTKKVELLEVETKKISGESIKWSPNGRYIAFENGLAKKTNLSIIEIDSKKVINLVECRQPSDSPMAWSPDSSKIAVFSLDDDALHIISIE